MGYKSNAQRKAVHASKADGGKGAPSKQTKLKRDDFKTDGKANKRRIKNKKERESKERLKKVSRKAKETKKAKSKSPAKKPLVGKQKNLPDHLKKKILASPAKMNRYDKDMMHERELIYDAKKEIHKEDMAKKKSMAKQNKFGGKKSAQDKIDDKAMNFLSSSNKFGGKKSKQDMIDDKAMNFLSSPSSPKSDNKQKKFNSMSPSKMSAELKYMPVVDREKSTMSAIGAHKVLKHMKGRM